MLRTVSKYIRYNLKSLVKFELVYKLLTLFLVSPLFSFLFRLIMKSNGFNYLTFENILDFFKKPTVIVLILLLLIFMMIYIVYEISTIILIIDASRQRKKVNLKEVLEISFYKTIMILKKTRLRLIFLVLFLIPFLNLGIASSYISVINIPEFIMDYISSNAIYFSLYLVLIIVLSYTLFRWIYTLNYMVLDNEGFNKARKKSIDLGKKNHFVDFIKIVLTEALIYISYLIFIFLGVGLIIVINKYVNSSVIINSFLVTVIWLFLALSLIIFSLIAIPLSYSAISYLFYKHKSESNLVINDVDFNRSYTKTRKPLIRNIKLAIYLIMLIGGTIYTRGIITGKYNLTINHHYKVELTAHRGASIKYPENTMRAFAEAKKQGADWVELDVQSTKDNIIIVIHDSNLKRITGVNRNVWELTYGEISKLDAGKNFNKTYAGEKIPLLDDVIKWAKENNVKLNIELKPTGREQDFEENVVNIIKENHFEKMCVVTSGNYDAIKRVKNISKKIKTIYVMSLAYGDILSLKDVDGYSIEASNITKSLVNKIHLNDKEIYAWTVNNEESIKKMVSYNVDNIITDDILNARDIINESKESNLIMDYAEFIRKSLR